MQKTHPCSISIEVLKWWESVVIYTASQIKANKSSRCDQTEPHNVSVAKIIIGAGNQMEVTLSSAKRSSYHIFREKYFFYNGSLRLSENE